VTEVSRHRSTLRRVAGVDEGLLEEVPTDRFRYTRLGGVIVGTATIATLSMWLGLTEITGRSEVLLAPVAVVWGLFIGNLDAWIVASLHGTRWRQQAWVVMPRLVLAVIFGFLIAEPLVLRAFAPAIERNVRDTRQAELLSFETRLKTCNPASGAPAPAGGCDGAQLVLTTPSPTAVVRQIKDLDGQRNNLEHAITKSGNTLATLERTARLECNGSPGQGLSGEFGVGVNCNRDREQADHFEATSRSDQQAEQLLKVKSQLRDLTERLKSATQRYERALSSAILQRVIGRKSNQRSIGLLERLAALGRLVAKNGDLAFAEWFLRMLFVTIDCLPMIVKVTSGTTAYDRILDRRVTTQEESFAARQKTLLKTVVSENDLEQQRLELQTRSAIEELESKSRLESARRNLEVDAAIDAYTDRLLREQRAAAASRRKRFTDQDATATGVGPQEF
jgi:hypothetical protein